jgi:8-oxo-dGTP diphosphatase
VVAVIRRDARYLVIRRSKHVAAPLQLCFPGGGLEPDETEPQALTRELREELGLTVTPIRSLWHCRTAWMVDLTWWEATIPAAAEPTLNPHEVADVYWMTQAEMLAQPDMLSSNVDFLRRFRLDLMEWAAPAADPARDG